METNTPFPYCLTWLLSPTITHQTKRMASTIVLITGGNRGLGHALLKRFLALPNHVRMPLARADVPYPKRS
jgi:hypothetical protein